VFADDVYEALVNLAEGKPLPPVKERTKAIRTATVRYWRAKGKISVKDDNGKKALYYEGRSMLRSSEVTKLSQKNLTEPKDLAQRSWLAV